MKALVGAFNQEKALVGACSVIVQPVVEPMDRFTALLKDVMALADILNTNPQNFIMEAYADDLQYYEPDPPNDTNPGVSMLLFKDHM